MTKSKTVPEYDEKMFVGNGVHDAILSDGVASQSVRKKEVICI